MDSRKYSVMGKIEGAGFLLAACTLPEGTRLEHNVPLPEGLSSQQMEIDEKECYDEVNSPLQKLVEFGKRTAEVGFTFSDGEGSVDDITIRLRNWKYDKCIKRKWKRK